MCDADITGSIKVMSHSHHTYISVSVSVTSEKECASEASIECRTSQFERRYSSIHQGQGSITFFVMCLAQEQSISSAEMAVNCRNVLLYNRICICAAKNVTYLKAYEFIRLLGHY